LRRFLLDRDAQAFTPDAGSALKQMTIAGMDQLPLPGEGATLKRWKCLALVAGHDLSLAKLYEAQTDALAILAELGSARAPAGSTWGVWCAEPPGAVVALLADGNGTGTRLKGRKAWCSGAASVSHALVSCRDAAGRPCLAAVGLNQPGVRITTEGWHAVGMAATASVDVEFDDVPAIQLGGPHAYLRRPGFWHGGAGIAACWYGAAAAIGERLRCALRDRSGGDDPHRLAQLSSVDAALSCAAALLRECATAIDAHPERDAIYPAMQARLAVEAAATQVLSAATRALGAGPLCRDPHFARLCADLPVFLRQSHAERDLAVLGASAAHLETSPWDL
jgi:alkylation response protein AidB-like acyl-CoA dehydrogenase